MKARFEEKGAFKYRNRPYQFPVMTNQEKELLINKVSAVQNVEENIFEVDYSTNPQKEFQKNWDGFFLSGEKKPRSNKRKPKQIKNVPVQLSIEK